MDERSELEEMRAELRELREEVARLRQERPAARGEDRATRRGVLAMAAGGALGATLATAAPAGAATGDPLQLGSVTNTTDAATGLAVSGNTAGYGFGVTDNGLNQLPPVNPALFGHAKAENFLTGVFGYVEAGHNQGPAMLAQNDANGSFAELGSVLGHGISCRAGTLGAPAVEGEGTYGDGVRGTSGTDGAGVHGFSESGTNPAVLGESLDGTGPGLQAVSRNGRGIVSSGKLAQLQLTPGTQKTHPKKGQTGDLFVDRSGRLWYCQVGGNIATWKQIA